MKVSESTKAERSKIAKVMLTTFFDVKDIVDSEFSSQSQMIILQIYKEIWWGMLCSERAKKWELWQDKSWLLHHNGAPGEHLEYLAVHGWDEHCWTETTSLIIWFCSMWLFSFSKAEEKQFWKSESHQELRGIPEESFQL